MKKRKELSVEEKKGNENNLRKGKSPNRSPSNSSNKKSEPDPNQIKIDTFFMTSKDPKPSPKALKSPDKDKELKKSETVIIHSDSELSYYSEDEKIPRSPVIKKKPVDMPNLMFYLNMIQSRPQGDFIDKIHSTWRGDYKKLEIHHGYVQWLFPNFYGSNFNKDAFKLSPEEARVFRNNKEVAEKLITSYELILDFFGMVILDKETGELGRSKNYEQRYYETLITSTHNHLRVRRILAHLNITGFRRYAIQFVDFLEKEMFGEVGGYLKFLNQNEITSDYRRELKHNPLYHVIKHNAFKDWRALGRAESIPDLEKLYSMCVANSASDLDESVYFRNAKK